MAHPFLISPVAKHKDSYRALVAEFVACGEKLIPFPLSFPNENFAAFLAHLEGYAKGIGIGRVMLTCAKENPASSAVIATNGGVLESESWVEARGEVVQRWWIDVVAHAAT